jgi:hypothetical protein
VRNKNAFTAQHRCAVFVAVALGAACVLLALPTRAATAASVPAAEAPVTLEFGDFYAQPVGRLGLEPSERLLHLNGHRVRLVGFMVNSEQPVAGVFMLAPLPVALSEEEDGPADDLPGSTVFVHLPGDYAQRTLKYRPGEWEVVGTLELGAREEANGRISYVRLLADLPATQR